MPRNPDPNTRPEPLLKRVLLYPANAPVDADPYNLWVMHGDDTVMLLYDYADCKPKAGWQVELEGKAYTVDKVDPPAGERGPTLHLKTEAPEAHE